MKNIYVGNLAWECSAEDLREMFAPFGQVGATQIIMDRDTNRSRGFGFVEMPNDEEALKAIGKLNGQMYKGRALTVNEARPREQRGPGGGGGGYGGRL